MKKALIVGIDDYPAHPLRGCVNDAISIASILERNGDGSPNFSIKLLASNDAEVSTLVLHDAIAELFSGDADTVLLFFCRSWNIKSRYKCWIYRKSEWYERGLGSFSC